MKKTKTPTNAKVKSARPTPTPPKSYTTAVCPACGAELSLSSEASTATAIDDENTLKAILQKIEHDEMEDDTCCGSCEGCDAPTIRGIELTPTSITVALDSSASIESLAEAYRFVFALRDMVYGTDGSLQINIVME